MPEPRALVCLSLSLSTRHPRSVHFGRNCDIAFRSRHSIAAPLHLSTHQQHHPRYTPRAVIAASPPRRRHTHPHSPPLPSSRHSSVSHPCNSTATRPGCPLSPSLSHSAWQSTSSGSHELVVHANSSRARAHHPPQACSHPHKRIRRGAPSPSPSSACSFGARLQHSRAQHTHRSSLAPNLPSSHPAPPPKTTMPPACNGSTSPSPSCRDVRTPWHARPPSTRSWTA